MSWLSHIPQGFAPSIYMDITTAPESEAIGRVAMYVTTEPTLEYNPLSLVVLKSPFFDDASEPEDDAELLKLFCAPFYGPALSGATRIVTWDGRETSAQIIRRCLVNDIPIPVRFRDDLSRPYPTSEPWVPVRRALEGYTGERIYETPEDAFHAFGADDRLQLYFEVMRRYLEPEPTAGGDPDYVLPPPS